MRVNSDGHKVPPRMTVDAYHHKMAERRLTDDGKEKPNPVPMEPPIGYLKQPSMVENIRNMIRSEELRRAAEAAGAETFDEADDFDVPDDPEPVGRYEVPDDLEPVANLRRKQKDAADAAARAAAEPPTGARPAPPAEPASE